MTKVSIIIPIYNVEQYLARCLDSVINQTHKEMDIICVNDCSPDNSSHILEKYAKKDARIKIVNREKNGGLSAARNSGMDVACGEYMFFLDSDDWIDPDYIESCLAAALKSNADIVINNSLKSVVGDTETIYHHPAYQGKNIDGVFWNPRESVADILCTGCLKFVKTSFIEEHHLRYPEGLVMEDLYFQHISFAYANSVYTFNGPFYYYFKREESIINTDPNKDITQIRVLSAVFDYFKEHHLLDLDMKIYSVAPFFNVNSEEKYQIYKDYFNKISEYLQKKHHLYNELDLFFMYNILGTANFDDYKQKFPPSVVMSFVRRKK